MTDSPLVAVLNRMLGQGNQMNAMESVPSDLESLLRELKNIKYALDQAAIVAVTDRAGRITYVNDKFVEISKYSREELIGQNHRIINSGYHSTEFWISMWKTISSGKIWEGEIRNRAKTGSYYWVNTTIVPFLNEKAEPEQYVSIRYEITQRKDAEAQILHQDRLASIGMLASGLAHEIGTPLGVIRGRAEYLSMQLPDESARKNLDVIITQIDRISKLIRSLLHLARSEHASVTTAVPIATTTEQVLALLAHEFRKQKIVIETEIQADARFKGESESFEQVILNLLVNAVHAIQSKQKAADADDNRILLKTFDRGAFWELRITDSGCGIPAENLKHLFKPFFTTKEIGVGTGLGLATTYKIITSWGGSIKVDSTHNVGTTFILMLPKI